MSATEKKIEKRIRKPRRNLAEERKKVVTYCQISLQIIGQIQKGAPDSMAPFFAGQTDALKGVLRELGEEI